MVHCPANISISRACPRHRSHKLNRQLRSNLPRGPMRLPSGLEFRKLSRWSSGVFQTAPTRLLARGKIDALNKARAEAEGAARGKELLDEHGHLAMHLAARNGQVAAMGWLKAQGADINGRDDEGDTPMHWAAYGGHVAAMGWLKAQGADINAWDDNGLTPMHSAAYGGQVAAMGWLKAQGADINTRDDDGNTPMHSAAEQLAESACRHQRAG